MRVLHYARSFEVVHELPEALAPLRGLVTNMRWTWDLAEQELFRDLDPDAWEATGHNPILVLNGLSSDRLTALAQDKVFLARMQACVDDLEAYMTRETWHDRAYPDQKDARIAYFCAEFGIHESFPNYSGGLGILAGDHLKAASDLGVPLCGVGLLYARGYFRQMLTPDGWQQERYPDYDFHNMPLTLVRGEDDQPVHVSIDFPDRSVTCQIWRAQVGRVPLILLDSNILENQPADQDITDTLYGGDEEMRIRQETILGIGGYRALVKLGMAPTVCHMNEGHAAFLTLERLRHFIQEHGCDFRTARQCVVAGNCFTTHTPVPAGFDKFSRPLLERHLSRMVSDLGLPFEQFLRYGRINPDDQNELFNMAVLAMENANHVNGVAKLHARVSREMFASRWPSFPVDEVPVVPVTNGIHTATWLGSRMAGLLDKHVGGAWRENMADPELWNKAAEIPVEELWEAREASRAEMVAFMRRHVKAKQLAHRPYAGPVETENLLDPKALTIGFARRFATYKRATLLFSDRDRIMKMLTNEERPVQFVFSGKAHPRDEGGKRLIQEIIRFTRENGIENRLLFVEDYDMAVARELVHGVDVWLNNPRRPMEASGTSGMKVGPNLGLNCSILDGWWDEGYTPEVGWAIGDRTQSDDHDQQDWIDSLSMYSVLEHEVIPKFYQRDSQGVPRQWMEMVQASLRVLPAEFSTDRMVREYAENHYMPAHTAFSALKENGLARAKAALAWRDRISSQWSKVKVISTTDTAAARNSAGQRIRVEARIELGELTPQDVRVQVLSGRVGRGRELTDLEFTEMSAGEPGHFQAEISAGEAGHRGYVVRVMPHNPDVNTPMELPLVEWQSA